MFGRIIYGDEQVVINGYTLSGIQSVDASYNTEVESLFDLTSGFMGLYAAQNVVGSFSISRLLVGTDPIRFLTGDVQCSGQFQFGGKNFGFLSGYMTSYKLEAGVGKVTNVFNSFIVFGEMGSGISGLSNIGTQYPIHISQPGGISIVCDGSSSNRILNFSYEYAISRKPIYTLNSQVPMQVITEEPINVTLSIDLEVNDYNGYRMLDVLCSPHYKDISVNLSGVCSGSNQIDSFNLVSGRLVGEAVRSSITNATAFTLTYKGVIL